MGRLRGEMKDASYGNKNQTKKHTLNYPLSKTEHLKVAILCLVLGVLPVSPYNV